ncbi:MAG TPA: lysylphosphatidylglycerol synthase transmembrane domain-containing protein [Polyangiaceae bacterium]|nr:lysylphosphatidylglycerol synthase transmembrane domain-containing protein [Polyangiaceae bacterium]
MSPAVRRLVGAMLLAVLLYGVAVAYTGLHTIQESLSTFAWSSFVFAVLLASFNYVLRFLRFRYYLGLLGVTTVGAVDALLVFLSGFVLTVTPGKVGEVFKSAVLAQTHDIPVQRTAPIVVVERLSDLIGVVALILVGSVGFPSGLSWALAGGGAVSAGFVLILWERPSNALVAFASRHPRLSRLAPKLEEAFRSLRLLAGPRAILVPLVLSVVAWASEGIALWVLLRGFGEHAPLTLSVFFYETASLAGALIPVPGGLGVVETMLREQLVHLGGVSVGAATSSMILVRFATLWWAVAVGFLALGILRSRFPRLRGVSP